VFGGADGSVKEVIGGGKAKVSSVVQIEDEWGVTKRAGSFVGKIDLIWYISDYCLSGLGVCRVLCLCYSSL
jgi:hypothetical protein